jgi:hypothetical protein
VNIAYFKFKICFLILLICLHPGSPFTAEAQMPVMRKYTLLDGYTATNGYVIQQDQKGYWWLGTENGALRFDGSKFELLRDRFMPADQEILSCNPYGKGQVLLVPLLNNIAYYKDGEIISSRKDPHLNLLRNTGQNSIFTDVFTGNIWLSNEARLKTLYCFSANEIRKVEVPDSGTYLFRAYANSAKGIPGKLPVILSIGILPAFWQILLFKAIVCLLAVLLSYFFVRSRINRLALRKYEQARQERRLAELELEAIKAHINPHFIYNCLNSLQYFNYEKQHDLSKQYLDLFARLVRFTMQYSRQAFITITEETAYLNNYLQLEKMRFQERLRYRIIVANDIDEQLLIPAMLIQPYVENALKHGIAARKEGGNVIIRFSRPEKDQLEISVEDDGVGFTPELNANNNSLGLRLSGSRAKTYNQLFGMKIQISFHNKKNLQTDESGTIVQIKIPTKS